MSKETAKKCWDEAMMQLKKQWQQFSTNDLPKLKATYETLKQDLKKKYHESKQVVEQKMTAASQDAAEKEDKKKQ